MGEGLSPFFFFLASVSSVKPSISTLRSRKEGAGRGKKKKNDYNKMN